MYGGSAILPSNSPHLRKFGSRAVFIDPSSQHFSSTEGANNSEEGFPLLTESDEMKGSSTPMTAATIVHLLYCFGNLRCRSTNLILCRGDYSRDKLMLQRIRNSLKTICLDNLNPS